MQDKTLRDRTGQATSAATSYAVAAGLFAAAGIFLVAALFVGAAALFRWIEINHGQFWAFGAVGGHERREQHSHLTDEPVGHAPHGQGCTNGCQNPGPVW